MGETVRVTPAVWVPDGDEALRSPAGTAYSRAPTPHLQFLGEIARGGMGTIYRARDHALGRVVAVKVLHDAHLGQAELRQRFLEEARITGQLQHPGVVPVFETGELSDRRPYFTMKLITGQTLARLLAGRRADQGHAPPSDWLSVFEQVCRTLAYAHARGVIHRDLKPANIMVGAFGEVQLMDWGLAKVLPSRKRQGPEDANRREDAMVVRAEGSAGERTPTRPGIVLGTPAYMPPEQAQGEVEALDARSDVFGLGAILCEILTGQPPYTAPNAAGVLRRAAQADLEDAFARLDRCGADAGLVALARRCLARDPERRPPDAGALVTELTACLRSVRSVRARRERPGRMPAGR